MADEVEALGVEAPGEDDAPKNTHKMRKRLHFPVQGNPLVSLHDHLTNCMKEGATDATRDKVFAKVREFEVEPLHLAAYQADLTLVSKLINIGHEANVVTGWEGKWTPLHAALHGLVSRQSYSRGEMDHDEMVRSGEVSKFLIQHGVKIDAQDSQGNNIAHIICRVVSRRCSSRLVGLWAVDVLKYAITLQPGTVLFAAKDIKQNCPHSIVSGSCGEDLRESLKEVIRLNHEIHACRRGRKRKSMDYEDEEAIIGKKKRRPGDVDEASMIAMLKSLKTKTGKQLLASVQRKRMLPSVDLDDEHGPGYVSRMTELIFDDIAVRDSFPVFVSKWASKLGHEEDINAARAEKEDSFNKVQAARKALKEAESLMANADLKVQRLTGKVEAADRGLKEFLDKEKRRVLQTTKVDPNLVKSIYDSSGDKINPVKKAFISGIWYGL